MDELKSEETSFLRDKEIARIMGSFRLDGYSVMDLLPGCTVDDIRRVYRRKSLLIHPDRTTNPQASDAFDRLRKAHDQLVEDGPRSDLDAAFSQARNVLYGERGWKKSHTPDPNDQEFLLAWRKKAMNVIMQEELRKQRSLRLRMAEDGREKRRVEEEAEKLKRKRAADRAWEETRDSRVQSWQSFKAGGKKKKKLNVLG